MTTTSLLKALVHTMRYEAQGIISVELRPVDGAGFPAFEAGSHIDLHLPNGLVRSYSLSNAPTDRDRYVVSVLLDRASRGGSRYVHEQLRVGMTLPISAPRNNFQLVEDAPRTVLVAGGIGVTPLWSMLQRLRQIARPVEMVYCARSRAEAAFVEEITAFAGDAVPLTWHFDAQVGAPPDLVALLAGRGADTHYYCCGPTPMLQAFEQACAQLGYPHAHIERFAAVELPPDAQDGAFDVYLEQSHKTVHVPAGKSLLDALLDAGVACDHSCNEGVCGSCEVRVLEGEVEHHDGILSKKERESNQVMMVCVSRARSPRLVLDL